MRTLSAIILACFGLLLGLAPGGAAERPADLFTATAVVTGTGAKNRQLGFAEALETVLVKVSGDPRIARDRRLKRLKLGADLLVRSFSYRDRLAGIPIHDEQGSYDRPHFLTVAFQPKLIGEALAALDRKPWMDPRPTLLVLVSAERAGKELTVTADGERDADMREALSAAAERVGLGLQLPDRVALTAAGLDADRFTPVGAGIPANPDNAPVLAGSLVWSDAALGWIATWRLNASGQTFNWQVRGVGFDDAFRNGLRGAMQALSGNGAPRSTR